MNSIIVFNECFTKSNLLKPWLSAFFTPKTESVSIDSETSITQIIEHGVLFFKGFAGGSISKEI